MFSGDGRSHGPNDRCRTRGPPPLRLGAADDGLCRPRAVGTFQRHETGARGAITKTGNAHLRRVLVEAAWHYRHRPFVGAALRRRQQGAAASVIAQAWTAQDRLYRRYHRLAGRGKPHQQVITAVARELTGIIWAALIQ